MYDTDVPEAFSSRDCAASFPSSNRSTITDFFGNQRTDTCQGCIDRFCNITWLFAYNISEIFFCDRQWVIFFLSLWREIIPSGRTSRIELICEDTCLILSRIIRFSSQKIILLYFPISSTIRYFLHGSPSSFRCLAQILQHAPGQAEIYFQFAHCSDACEEAYKN